MWGIWTLSGWGEGFELEMSSLSGGIQVFYLNMEESKGKDFSFPSGVAQKIVDCGGMLKLWSNQLI